MKNVLGVGISGAFSTIGDASTVTDDIVGRPFTTFPWVHAVLETFTAGVANMAWNTMGGSTFIGVIIT